MTESHIRHQDPTRRQAHIQEHAATHRQIQLPMHDKTRRKELRTGEYSDECFSSYLTKIAIISPAAMSFRFRLTLFMNCRKRQLFPCDLYLPFSSGSVSPYCFCVSARICISSSCLAAYCGLPKTLFISRGSAFMSYISHSSTSL